jgi:hypothetical protein
MRLSYGYGYLVRFVPADRPDDSLHLCIRQGRFTPSFIRLRDSGIDLSRTHTDSTHVASEGSEGRVSLTFWDIVLRYSHATLLRLMRLRLPLPLLNFVEQGGKPLGRFGEVFCGGFERESICPPILGRLDVRGRNDDVPSFSTGIHARRDL